MLSFRAVQETTFDLEGDVHSGTALPASKVSDYKSIINNETSCQVKIILSVVFEKVLPVILPQPFTLLIGLIIMHTYLFFLHSTIQFFKQAFGMHSVPGIVTFFLSERETAQAWNNLINQRTCGQRQIHKTQKCFINISYM